ncbi:MAG: hypothetical protein KF819_39195, partial [Labilithrix sp.]|nr:hypothetical protein [Labilithrix sp.]
MMPWRSFLVGLAAASAGVVAVVACTTRAEPKDDAPTSSGGPPSSSGGSSGSGLDATPPDGPIACGAAPASSAPFTKQALLGAVADCAAWHACNFQNAATALRKSFRDH